MGSPTLQNLQEPILLVSAFEGAAFAQALTLTPRTVVRRIAAMSCGTVTSAPSRNNSPSSSSTSATCSMTNVANRNAKIWHGATENGP
jgi:hypothetical protein